LLEEDGYIKVTDFGLSKIMQGSNEAACVCGTLDYMAPEVLNRTGHSFPVDWWSLGIIIYEMIVGFTPFYTGAPNMNKMLKIIKKKKLFFPDA